VKAEALDEQDFSDSEDDALDEAEAIAKDETYATRSHLPLLLILCLAAPLLVIAKLGANALTFPYWDAWRVAPMLELSDSGQLSMADLWAQHNEHRIFFPKLLMVTLARLSGWNVAWEIVASLCFATLIFACVGVLLFRATRSANIALRVAGLALCSALVYSWSQNENWVWGFQHNVWLAMSMVFLGVVVLDSAFRFAPRILLAMVVGVVASFSYANGLFYWIALLPLVWDLRVSRAARVGGLGVWLLVAALVYVSYFIGYVQPAVSPPLSTALQHPILFMQFFAVLIGAPISACFTQPAWHGVDALPPWWAYLPGPLGVAAFVGLLWQRWQRTRDWAALAPWVALGAFALGSAAVASAGRCGFGLGQALTSRYITVTTPLWIALVVLVLCVVVQDPRWAKLKERAFAIGITAASTLALIAGAATHSPDHEQRCHWKRMGWLAIQLGFAHPVFLHDLSDQPEVLGKQILPWLAQTKRCGIGTPLENPAQYAPQFLRDAEQLAALGLGPQAGVYLEIAARLDAGLPGIAELKERLKAPVAKP